MLGWWTIGRASGLGASAGLLALILWPLCATFQEPLRLPFVAALAVTAFCGASILLITIIDIGLRRDRGARVRPIRSYDVALSLLMMVPSLMALESLV